MTIVVPVGLVGLVVVGLGAGVRLTRVGGARVRGAAQGAGDISRRPRRRQSGEPERERDEAGHQQRDPSTHASTVRPAARCNKGCPDLLEVVASDHRTMAP